MSTPTPAPREAEPFWHAVVSDKAPVINKAIRRLDVAEEYADKCRENGYPGVEVTPLYAAPVPRQAAPTQPPADAERHLRNLLARIHRDGGHYADEHGLQQASEDAETLVVQWLGDEALLRQAVEALKRADSFITNGVALGYIRMPDADTPDAAHGTPPAIRAALAALSARLAGEKP